MTHRIKDDKPQSIIRRADICDIDAIMQIWETENNSAHNFIPSKYWKQNYATVKNALPQAEIYVYIDNCEIIGFIGLNGNYIEGIFVKANKQNKGVGSALLERVKKLKSNLTLSVYKQNVNAVKFYIKNGFTVIGEGIDESTNENEMTMQWNSLK